MSRTKSPSARTHRKTLKAARGFKQSRSRRIKAATEAVMHAGQYAYAGRRLKKRDLRSIWIVRINAAARLHDMSYSELVKKLKDNKIELDRKILAEIAATEPATFSKIISELK